jgi:translation initiation factor 4E
MTHTFEKDNNSQFICIGEYTNESHDTVRMNIIHEMSTYKEEYIDLLNENDSFDEYINKMSQINTPGDNITLIAASQYYQLNICVNDEINIIIKDNEKIDLYLNKIDNFYSTGTHEYVDVNSKKLITIFDDPVNYNVKHPLNTEWCLWMSTKVKSDNWLDTIKNVITVNSVEDFWSVFNNIPEAANLNFPFDYYFFRKDIMPMWEDTQNKNGGKMTITFKKNCNSEYFNKVWLYTVLGCIGEQFDNFICGAVLNIRKHQDRVNIWLSTDTEEDIKSIGLRWKEILELPKINISYIKHEDSTIQYIL